MKLVNTVLTDALVLQPSIFEDERGHFFEAFNAERLNRIAGRTISFVQDNQSLSARGTLRGLHFQKEEMAQAKLVRVTSGAAYDVAVDLRPNSPTFKKWFGLEISAENRLQFFIPRGFAHGFVALERDTIFQYKVDNYYSSLHDGGVIWNDPELNIGWPGLSFNLSPKDSSLPILSEIDCSALW